MGTFLAIMGDTWRQSKQQIVFLLLIGAMAVFTVGWVFFCRVAPTADGTYVATLPFNDEPAFGFDAFWDGEYEEVLIGEKRRTMLREPAMELGRARAELDRAAGQLAQARLREASPEVEGPLEEKFNTARAHLEEKAKAYEELEAQLRNEAQKLIDERAPGISPLHKGVQVWMRWGVRVLVYLAILGFIAAGSGYFPSLLAAGAIDIIVSKPLPRWQIFFGKYVGGLALMSAAVLGALLVMFVGMGLKTGIWHLRIFAAMPVIVFIVALMYALVLCVGVITRSTPLAIVIGYIYYVVIELGIWALQGADKVFDAAGVKYAWLTTTSETVRWVFPGFARLHSAAEAAVLNVPIFDWQPLLVGGIWLAGLLGAAYVWFERTDF